MFITKQLLIDLDACQHGIEAFSRVFPNGTEFTEDAIKIAQDNDLPDHMILWFMEESKMTIENFNLSGNKYWYTNGQLNRSDGPAAEYANGNKYWYINGQLDRFDGPAIEYADGEKRWYTNGQLNRANGPAIEYPDGRKAWFINGQLNRADGPAIEYPNGRKEWYRNGKEL